LYTAAVAGAAAADAAAALGNLLIKNYQLFS